MMINKHKIIGLFLFTILLFEIILNLIGCSPQNSGVNKADDTYKNSDKQISDNKKDQSNQLQNENMREQILQLIPGIVCIGDSLTFGYGGEGITYPNTLQKEMKLTGLDVPVINLGACGEDSLTITGRNGGIPYAVGNDFDLPAEIMEVPISIVSSDSSRKVRPGLFTDVGINECNIGGIIGTIKIQTTGDINSSYTFLRKEKGPAIHIAAGTQIITEASDMYDDYIPIVFMGTNGGYDSYLDLVTQQNAVIGSKALNGGKYLVVGITTGDREFMADYDQAMYDTYQEHYFNLREYLSVAGMHDAGLRPTEEDISFMQAGMVPTSLRCDLVHFNKTGYEVVGKAIYNKLKDLGYFDDASALLSGNIKMKGNRDDAFQFAKDMKAGINVGNALDAYGSISYNDITQYETAWNNPVITERLFKTIKDAGFTTVRIPVTWQNHCDSDFTIDKEWLGRVKQVVDYGRKQDLYVVLDIHHDQWMEPSYKNMYRSLYGTRRIWSQIAENFEEYDEHLIFEGFNEPRLLNCKEEWGPGTAEAYFVINQMMQCFVNTVRAGKGHNPNRYLIITAYRAGDQKEMLNALQVPDDPNLLLSVHMYIPYEFALKNDGTTKWSLSSIEDTKQIDFSFDNLQKFMMEKNIPIVITEFGAVDKENESDRNAWCSYVTKHAREKRIPFIWWDNNYPAYYGEGTALLDRNENKIVRPDIVNILVGENDSWN